MKTFRLFLFCATVASLTACGVKGPLYFPVENSAQSQQ